MGDEKAGCGACITLFIAVVGAFLLAKSFDSVTPEKIGINFNSFKKEIEETKVYTSGRFRIGIGHSFVSYPRNIQTIEFAKGTNSDAPRLGVWSKDGQNIEIACSFMYTLVPERTIDIYRKFGASVDSEPWKALYIQAAQSVIKSTTTQFYTEEFFRNRTDIGELIFSQLRAKMWENFGQLRYFQLRTISIPYNFEASVTKKLTAKQAVKRSVYENDARIVRKGIDQVIREAQATANYLQLQATATGTLLQQEAEARGKQLKVLGQAEAYESLKESMGMTNSDLLYFKYMRTLRQRKNTRLLVDTGSSVMLNK